jgi:hypothetical protein
MEDVNVMCHLILQFMHFKTPIHLPDVADQQRDHETLHDALREMGGHSEYSAASILIVATKVRKFKGNQN